MKIAPEPDEVLVSDPRGRLSPAQMVDAKVLALLRVGHPGLYLQAAGQPSGIRRTFEAAPVEAPCPSGLC